MRVPTTFGQVNSRGWGEQMGQLHHYGLSPASQVIIERAIAYLREHGGAKRDELLKALGKPGDNATITMLERNCPGLYVGDAKLDPEETTGWYYVDD